MVLHGSGGKGPAAKVAEGKNNGRELLKTVTAEKASPGIMGTPFLPKEGRADRTFRGINHI
jgi:hypothetical protein